MNVPRRVKFVIIACLTLTAAGAALMVDQSDIGKKMAGHVLTISENHRFKIANGQELEMVFVLSSMTSGDVRVVGATVPCGCLSVSPLPLVLPPGQSRELKLVLDTKDQKPGTRDYRVPLILDTKAPPVEVQFSVEILPRLQTAS